MLSENLSTRNERSEAQIRTLLVVLAIGLFISFLGFGQSYDSKGKMLTNPSNATNITVKTINGAAIASDTNVTARFLTLNGYVDGIEQLITDVTNRLAGTILVGDGSGAFNVIVDSGTVTIGSPLGQTTKSASIPVTLASDQSAPPLTNSTASIGKVSQNEIGSNNIAQVGGTAISLGQTTKSGSIPVTLPSDLSAAPLTNSTANIGKVTQNEIGSNNVAQVGGSALALGQTTMSASVPVTIASNQSVVPIGQQLFGSTATNVGGYTPFMQVSAATINTNTWSGSACTLGYLTAFNSNAAPRYVCILDSTTNRSPAEGSTSVLVQKFMIPGNTAGAGFVVPLPYGGIKLVNGLVTATVTGMATNDANAVGATEVLISGGYKN